MTQNNNVPLSEVAKFKNFKGERKASLKELNMGIKKVDSKTLDQIEQLKAHDPHSNKMLKKIMQRLHLTQTVMAKYLDMATGASISAWIKQTNGVKGIPPARIDDVKLILRGQYYLANLIPVMPVEEGSEEKKAQEDNDSMPKTRFDPILDKAMNTDYPGPVVEAIMDEDYEKPFKWLHSKNAELAEMCTNFRKAQEEVYNRSR